ncbi:hypothetical protein V6N12_045472 [Hibiscus sabdariffa]|uniref:Uncharacterized protein n=2 Tax=Hibiscus sabdariffa TaxID=183260 RepID=A0ABR2G2W2_9ROSI
MVSEALVLGITHIQEAIDRLSSDSRIGGTHTQLAYEFHGSPYIYKGATSLQNSQTRFDANSPAVEASFENVVGVYHVQSNAFLEDNHQSTCERSDDLLPDNFCP